MLAEEVGEVQQLPGIAGEAGELREDETSNVTVSDVPEHPSGLRVVHHRFAAHRLEVVDLFNTPPLRLGVVAGALLVVFRAFTFRLVFGGDADPNADGFLFAQSLCPPENSD